MLFVKPNEVPSSLLRGDHIAAALGCRCLLGSIGDTKDDVVIIKQAKSSLVKEAKYRGCRIIYDVLDWLCYASRSSSRMQDWYELVDVVIIPNRACEIGYRKLFPNAKFALIPHQWDYRITGYAQQDRFVPGYIGKAFNCHEKLDVDYVTEFDDMVESMANYNCHLSMVAPDLLWRWKPATKIASASAVGANILAMPDPSARELLPDDYPYWIGESPHEALEYARGTFGTSTWKRGLEMMAAVRERTSLESIAALYKEL